MSKEFKTGEQVWVPAFIQYEIDSDYDAQRIAVRSAIPEHADAEVFVPISDISRTPPMSEYDEEIVKCASQLRVASLSDRSNVMDLLFDAVEAKERALRPKTAEQIVHDTIHGPAGSVWSAGSIVRALRDAGLLKEEA